MLYIVIGYDDEDNASYYGPFTSIDDANKNVELGTEYCGCARHEIRPLVAVIGSAQVTL